MKIQMEQYNNFQNAIELMEELSKYENVYDWIEDIFQEKVKFFPNECEVMFEPKDNRYSKKSIVIVEEGKVRRFTKQFYDESRKIMSEESALMLGNALTIACNTDEKELIIFIKDE